MNPLHRRQFLGLSLGVAASPSILTAAAPAGGPAPAVEELMKFKKCEIIQEQTPDFTLKGATKEKRFKPKDWLELEFEWDVKPSKKRQEIEPKFYDDVTIKYYVFLSPADVTKKKLLVADVTYINVPIDETIHSGVFISPASFYNLTGDKLANKNAVTFWGAEVTIAGALVGRASSQNGPTPWWKAANVPPAEEGRLLPKHKTPFAPLWSDYYMEEKADK